MNGIAHHRVLAAAVAVTGAMVFSTMAQAQDGSYKWPKLFVIGTPGTAGGTFASTNGWGPVLQKETGMTVRIAPEDNEAQRFRRLTERRDIAMGTTSTSEVASQVQGVGGYAAIKPAAQRVVWHHNDSPWSYVVSGDSDLNTMADLKRGGVRVAEGMFSPTMSVAVREGLAAYLDIPLAEVGKVINYVPASSYSENCRSVVEGKVDAAWCSAISSISSEMEGAPAGIRWLPMSIEDKAAWERYLDTRPMAMPGKIEIGVRSARGVDGMIATFAYMVPADADEEFIYQLAKWLHRSFDAYKSTHPLSARMSLELFRKYLDHSGLPVHEGTVRYLREVGAWTDADDAWNKDAIAQMDRWNAARQAALDEAAQTGVKIDFQNPAFAAILEKHTTGLAPLRTRL